MGFLSGVKAGLGLTDNGPGLISHTKSIDAIGQGASSASLFGSSSSSIGNGNQELLSAYNANPHFRKVVSLIANQLTSAESYLEKTRQGSGRNKALTKSMARKAQNVREGDVIVDDPFLDFWYGGSPLLPGPDGLLISFKYYLIDGDWFWWLMPHEDSPAGMYWLPLPPTWVSEMPTSSKPYYKVRWGNRFETVPEGAILHIKNPNVVNPYGRGAGDGEALRDELDTDEYASRLMRLALANNGMVSGIVALKGANPNTLVTAAREYEQRHRGSNNAGRVMFLDGEKATYTPMAQAMSELKLLELRDSEKRLVEEALMVPPELFGRTENSNKATSFVAMDNFARNVLRPILTKVYRAINLQLLPLFDKTNSKVFWFVDPAPADRERTLEIMKLAPQAFEYNEIREEAGFSAVPWGSVRATPGMLLETPTGGASSGKKSKAGRLNKAEPAQAITDDQIQRILELYTPGELAERLGPEWQTRMREIAGQEFSSLGVSPGFDVVNPLIEDHVREFGLKRLKVPLDTSRTLAAAQIAEGVNNLESIGDIARRLLSVGATDQTWRARMIARTEVVRSANLAREASWQASGVADLLRKRWLSALSSNTRDSHGALHRHHVRTTEVFEFNGTLEPGIAARTTSPGNSGVGAHDINCQCTAVAFYVDGDNQKAWDFGSTEHIAHMKAFDEERQPWEDNATEEISKFYKDIERKTLDILGVKPGDL